MINETVICETVNSDIRMAFAHPEERALAAERAEAAAGAAAGATAGAPPRDRISLRDHILTADIGAFQQERGHGQRLRFNLVVELRPHAGPLADDVDRILSYDWLTESIAAELAAERLNLLETLAERVALHILRAPQAMRVYVRIEKLDRGPGALGVEIMRERPTLAAGVAAPQAPAQQPAAQPTAQPGPAPCPAASQAGAGPEAPGESAPSPAAPLAQTGGTLALGLLRPWVAYFDNALIGAGDLAGYLDRLEAEARSAGAPLILAVGLPGAAAPQSGQGPTQRRIDLLAIEQNAWCLAARDPRCLVVASRTEIDWAMKQGQTIVWAPSKIVLDALEGPRGGIGDGLALAAWLAEMLGAQALVVHGDIAAPAGSRVPLRRLAG